MRPRQKFIDLRMSLGYYKILNPSHTFRLSLIFPPLAFHLTNLEKKKKVRNEWLWKKKTTMLIIRTKPTFRNLLLCFCIVSAEHFRSLNEMRSRRSRESSELILSHHQSCSNQEHKTKSPQRIGVGVTSLILSASSPEMLMSVSAL